MLTSLPVICLCRPIIIIFVRATGFDVATCATVIMMDFHQTKHRHGSRHRLDQSHQHAAQRPQHIGQRAEHIVTEHQRRLNATVEDRRQQRLHHVIAGDLNAPDQQRSHNAVHNETHRLQDERNQNGDGNVHAAVQFGPEAGGRVGGVAGQPIGVQLRLTIGGAEVVAIAVVEVVQIDALAKWYC